MGKVKTMDSPGGTDLPSWVFAKKIYKISILEKIVINKVSILSWHYF
jgi:hypothetical protein